jgi:1,4-dihydroxy-2-naphthoyl-CoA hydrolase
MSEAADQSALFKLGVGQTLPAHLGLECVSLVYGKAVFRLPVVEHVLAPNGFLHAGSVVTLADSASGMGCQASLPEGAQGFTTIELKSNFMGTAREGSVLAVARLVHAGKMTQVWEALVTNEATSKTIARFSCTQMILYPRD